MKRNERAHSAFDYCQSWRLKHGPRIVRTYVPPPPEPVRLCSIRWCLGIPTAAEARAVKAAQEVNRFPRPVRSADLLCPIHRKAYDYKPSSKGRWPRYIKAAKRRTILEKIA